jgi:hypothetical protein
VRTQWIQSVDQEVRWALRVRVTNWRQFAALTEIRETAEEAPVRVCDRTARLRLVDAAGAAGV